MNYMIVLVGTEKIDVPGKLILDCPNSILGKKFDVFYGVLNNFDKSAYFLGILARV